MKMSKYTYVVYGGAGAMGLATCYDLAQFCDAAAVVVVDPHAGRLEKADMRLRALFGNKKGPFVFTAQPGEQILRTADVILSCAPHKANVDLAQLAMQHGAAYCDLGGSHEVVALQKMYARMRNTSSAVVPDCGWSPGLASIIAVRMAKKYGCNRISIRCGGVPHRRPDPKKNKLLHKSTWSAIGLAHEYAGKAMTIRNGILYAVRALSKIEKYDDEFESAPTSNNSHFIVEYLRDCGVDWFDYQTLRYHGHFRAVLGDKKKIDEEEFVKRVLSDPAVAYDRERDYDRGILVVEGGKGTRSLKETIRYRIDIVADHVTRFSAMELLTSWGIAIVAHHMASGRGKPQGFATPEMFVDSDWVMTELKRRLKQYQKD